MCNASLKIFATVLIATVSSFSFADTECTDLGTQLAMAECFKEEMESADKELNAAYLRYLNTLANKKEEANLRAAQRAWLKFRDMDCSAVVQPEERWGIEFTEWAGCVTRRTRDRTKDLEEMANCTENGCFPVRKPFLTPP